ncbi:MAG: hypothetical protein JXL84_13715 [Deltaproteobacteria bacterium]|nr:hypothetical protein [Deltaproteobacteria bacterium]
MPDEIVRKKVYEGWASFVESLEESVATLEKEIDFTSKMVKACTLEWCQATEHAIDDISNSLFSISEPSWLPDEDSKKLKMLKRRVHDVYSRYKAAAGKK